MSARRGTILVELDRLAECADPGLYSSDFKHANARGHAVAADETIRRLGEHLRATARASRAAS